MHYFIHIVTDTERIPDPDGEAFVDLDAARVEASQSARDLMALELMAGRPVPFGWQVQIADPNGAVVLTIPFAGLVFGTGEASRTFAPVTGPAVMERAKAIYAKARRTQHEINDGLHELRSQVGTLAQLTAALRSR